MANEPENSNDGPLDRAIAILTFVAEQKKALSAAEIAPRSQPSAPDRAPSHRQPREPGPNPEGSRDEALRRRKQAGHARGKDHRGGVPYRAPARRPQCRSRPHRRTMRDRRGPRQRRGLRRQRPVQAAASVAVQSRRRGSAPLHLDRQDLHEPGCPRRSDIDLSIRSLSPGTPRRRSPIRKPVAGAARRDAKQRLGEDERGVRAGRGGLRRADSVASGRSNRMSRASRCLRRASALRVSTPSSLPCRKRRPSCPRQSYRTMKRMLMILNFRNKNSRFSSKILEPGRVSCIFAAAD